MRENRQDRVLHRLFRDEAVSDIDRVPVVFAGIHGEDEHSCEGKAPFDGFRGLNAVEIWHVEVHEDEVRMQSFRLIDRFPSIRGLSHHFHPLLRAEERRQDPPESFMVICQQHLERRHVEPLPSI